MKNKDRFIISQEIIDQYKNNTKSSYLKEIEDNLDLKKEIKNDIKTKISNIKDFFKSNKLMYFITLMFIIIFIFWYISLYILQKLSNV